MNQWQLNRIGITLAVACFSVAPLPIVPAQSPLQNKRELAIEDEFQKLRSTKFGVRQLATQRLAELGSDALIEFESRIRYEDIDFQRHCIDIIALIGRDDNARDQAMEALQRLSDDRELACSGEAAYKLHRLKEANIKRAVKFLTSTGARVNRMGADGPIYSVSGITRDEQCEQLQYFLKLSNVSLSGKGVTNKCIPLLAKSTAIQGLSISQTSISTTGLAELSKVANLNRLSLYGNFSSEGISELKKIKRLTSLTLLMRITEEDLEQIIQIPLSSLLLTQLQMSPKVSKLLQKVNLKQLTLHLTGVEDTGLNWVRDCKAKSIQLTINISPKLTDTGIEHLQHSNVYQLNLVRTGITEKALKTIGTMLELQSLSISDSPIDDDSLMHLKDLQLLRQLSLTNTKVTAAGIEAIKAQIPRLGYARVMPPPKPVAKPAAQKPAAQKPVAPKPVAPKPVAPKPAAQKPAAQKPVAPKVGNTKTPS